MAIEQSDRRFAIASRSPRVRRFLGAPAWYLRMRLRCTNSEIARVQQQLGDEFAIAETAPLHDDLQRLLAERDELARRLGVFD